MNGKKINDTVGMVSPRTPFGLSPIARKKALAWGGEVSELMAREFFRRSGWEEKDIPSWKEAGYAHWIEDPPGPQFTDDLLASLLVVERGKIPDDLGWLTRSAPEG